MGRSRGGPGGRLNREIYIFPKVFAFVQRRKFAKLFKVSERKKSKKRCEREKHISTKVFAIFKLQKALRKPLEVILMYVEASRDGLEAS